jgi:adenosylcobinamide-GDP ribazoletransferase
MFQDFFEAIRFLTLIPVPSFPWLKSTSEDFEQTIANCMAWFPAVGLLVGLMGCAAGVVAGFFWPQSALVRALAVVIVTSIVTGGLHLDGLSDTFDATMSWRSRERMLEIMKDSRIGAMGSLALIAVLLLKVGFLAAAGERWWQAALLAPMLGRWADIYGIFFYPAAREGGLGKTFHDKVKRRDFVWGSAFVVLAMGLVAVFGAQPVQALTHSFMAWALAFAAAVYLCRKWVQQLGGLTGDTYGALSEMGEAVVLGAMSVQLG